MPESRRIDVPLFPLGPQTLSGIVGCCGNRDPFVPVRVAPGKIVNVAMDVAILHAHHPLLSQNPFRLARRGGCKGVSPLPHFGVWSAALSPRRALNAAMLTNL